MCIAKLINEVKICHIVLEKEFVREFGALLSDAKGDL